MLTVSAALAPAQAPAAGELSRDELAAYRVSPAAIAARKRLVTELARQIDPGAKDNGKQSLRIALARLQHDPTDKAALDQIVRSCPFEAKDDHFTKIQLAYIYGLFGPPGRATLPETVLAALRSQAAAYPKYFGGGTENHLGMQRVAAMTFGQAYPEMKTPDGLTGRETAERAVEWMRRYGREVYRWSMAEYLSTIYLGVHNEIWLTAYQNAGSEKARAIARAMLDWMWADLAVNAALGQIAPPLPRDKTMITNGPQMSYPNAHIQWMSWLYWGDEHSRPGGERLPPYLDAFKPGMSVNQLVNDVALGFQTAIVPAVSPEYPNDIIRNIGAKRVALPYRLLQARPNLAALSAAAAGPDGKQPSQKAVYRYNLRSVYIAQDYAVGAGYFRFADNAAEPDNLKHLMPSGIVYRSADALNRVHVAHPYWYTAMKDEGTPAATGKELGLDNWSGKSPFEQGLHCDNALLYLWDIPPTDAQPDAPPPGKSAKWISERLPKPIQAACVYVPESMDDKRQTPWGWLLREGDVYIALRPVGAERTEWQKCDHSIQAGHERFVIHGGRIGLVVEVGDRAEYGSPDAFAEKVGRAPLEFAELDTSKTDGASLEASYLTTRGHALRLQFLPGGGFPRAWTDGTALDFENWPVCESPYVTCREGVLDVNDGRKGFVVDWSGDDPVYRQYDVAGAKAPAR